MSREELLDDYLNKVRPQMQNDYMLKKLKLKILKSFAYPDYKEILKSIVIIYLQ